MTNSTTPRDATGSGSDNDATSELRRRLLRMIVGNEEARRSQTAPSQLSSLQQNPVSHVPSLGCNR